MKLTIRTAELTRALYLVQGIADKKSTMPVLAHALFTATNGGRLEVSATDNDVSLLGTYEADVTRDGRIAVHARQLYDIVKSLSAEQIDLEKQDNNWVELRAGSSRFRLVGMPADDFPAFPSVSDVPMFKLPSSRLMGMVDRTIFCVSQDENRHNLSGIYCEVPSSHLLRLVATDGHRLATCESTFEAELKLGHGVIVPRKGFQELRRILSDSDSQQILELGFSSKAVVFKAGTVLLTSRLIEGQFPDHRQVIPQQSGKQARLNRSLFADALRRVSLLSQGRAHGVRLEFAPGALRLVAEDPEYGEAQEMMAAEYTGEPLTIGFNARYILDVLGLIPEQGIIFDLSDDLSPAVIRPLEDKSFIAVVMPMRF